MIFAAIQLILCSIKKSVVPIALLKLTFQISGFREALGFKIHAPRHMTGGSRLGKGALQKGHSG